MNLINLRLSATLLAKRPVVTVIKLVGLTIGVAVATLLMIYADQELSYDKHFEHSDRIYRTLTIWAEGNSVTNNPICLRSIYDETIEKVPEAEAVVQILRGGSMDVRKEKDNFRNKRLLYADPEFEEVFTPDLLAGDLQKALTSPGLLVITDRLAQTIFGDEQAIGQTLILDEKNYTVEAVIREFPYQTHFRFDMLAAMQDIGFLDQLGGLEFFTYTLFKEGINQDEAVQKCSDLYLSQLNNRFQQAKMELSVEMEPLEKIHLATIADYDLSPNGDKTIIISLSLLAILILALALTNYINLYMVHSENRSLEIGIRRASGSGRLKLRWLFFSESLVITLIAFLFALVILHATSSWIRTSFGLVLNPEIWSDPAFYLKVTALLLITATLGGVYPAVYLSSINPVRAIYPNTSGGTRKGRLTRMAVLLQFSITVFLLISVGLLNRQMNFISRMPLGFSPEGVMTVSNLNSTLIKNQVAIREELRSIPHVKESGASQSTPAGGKSGQFIFRYGDDPDNGISIAEERVQPGYFKTLGIEIVEGRSFRDGFPYDRNCVILNETAVQKLGLDQPIGTRVVIWEEPMEVIGVAKNFHFTSLKNDGISPLVFTYNSEMIYNFMIRVEPGYEKEVRENVLSLFHEYDADQPLSIDNLSDLIKARYHSDYQLSKILIAGALLAIILSIMGLYAMSLYIIQDRTKEIGVRKVLGATVAQVTFQLTWSILKWSVIAIPIGAVPAYLLMKNWIDNFAYKADLAWWLFLPAGGIAVGIAMLTVILQIIKVGRKNPVYSLRYE